MKTLPKLSKAQQSLYKEFQISRCYQATNFKRQRYLSVYQQIKEMCQKHQQEVKEFCLYINCAAPSRVLCVNCCSEHSQVCQTKLTSLEDINISIYLHQISSSKINQWHRKYILERSQQYNPEVKYLQDLFLQLKRWQEVDKFLKSGDFNNEIKAKDFADQLIIHNIKFKSKKFIQVWEQICKLEQEDQKQCNLNISFQQDGKSIYAMLGEGEEDQENSSATHYQRSYNSNSCSNLDLNEEVPIPETSMNKAEGGRIISLGLFYQQALQNYKKIKEFTRQKLSLLRQFLKVILIFQINGVDNAVFNFDSIQAKVFPNQSKPQIFLQLKSLIGGTMEYNSQGILTLIYFILFGVQYKNKVKRQNNRNNETLQQFYEPLCKLEEYVQEEQNGGRNTRFRLQIWKKLYETSQQNTK